MRLIRLRIRNIASLKGEHEIDFLEIQKISTLFAITGETGSGKSSILNCIGLCLYGDIYKKNVQQLDVVTLGEKEGSIELIFQVKGQYYYADWKAKVRKQNGEPYSSPQTPTRNLYTIERPEFHSTKHISPIGVIELLNLNFDQFCKCIILNQGEFAKFLGSSFTDRKEILEKLYPGELLENMGRELKNEIETLERSKNEIEIKLGELKGDEVSGVALKKQKEEFQSELINLELTLKNFDGLDRGFTSLLAYYDKYNENDKKIKSLTKDLETETTSYNALTMKGEILLECFQKSKKNQEIELPRLQDFLKKEENAKLAEETITGLSKKNDDLSKIFIGLNERLKSKSDEAEESRIKLIEAGKQLQFQTEYLKEKKGSFESLFDLFNEKELLQEELKGKSETLQNHEATGLEIKKLFETIEIELKSIPLGLEDLEKSVLNKKEELTKKTEQRHRSEIHSQELVKQIEVTKKEIQSLHDKRARIKKIIEEKTNDLLPLETTLKLQDVLNATEICIDHALEKSIEVCPVCDSHVLEPKWQSLKKKLAETDLKAIRKKFDEGSKILYQSTQEEEHFSQKLILDQNTLSQKESELEVLRTAHTMPLPPLNEIEEELQEIKKKIWKKENLEKDLLIKKLELQKARDQYIKSKNEMTVIQKELEEKITRLNPLADNLKEIIPIITRDSIRELRLEIKHFNLFLEHESALSKILREKDFLLEQRKNTEHELSGLLGELNHQLARKSALSEELMEGLKGEKASTLIQKLNQLVKVAGEEWQKQNEDQRKQEHIIKDAQGRLFQLEELRKDYDLQFGKERHFIRELAKENDVPEIMKLRDMDLEFGSPREIFIPLRDLIISLKEDYKHKTNECRMSFASVSTRLLEWDKLQDKIQLLAHQHQEMIQTWNRKQRLFEVLGRDELRTFVLSLVEENLIQQTNEELQKLCQGRYEIVHQTKSMKMTPEFYILDKFRGGGRRKVSTLSGGETFMVSLAMALGLAELTRGQAEIDSLFIDEGFGTLDQESLEDVLDMLQQIQTRGLMVGIISHIKTLTNALPVNLVLQKKSDGTSSLGLKHN